MGRATQGVRLINLREGDAIAAIAKVPSSIDNGENEEGDGSVDTSSDANIEEPQGE